MNKRIKKKKFKQAHLGWTKEEWDDMQKRAFDNYYYYILRELAREMPYEWIYADPDKLRKAASRIAQRYSGPVDEDS